MVCRLRYRQSVEKTPINKNVTSKFQAILSTASAAIPKEESSQGAAATEVVIPVVAEELEVGKHVVETGRVNVTKVVEEYDESLAAMDLVNEHIAIERIPIGRFIETPPAVRQEGTTLVVPVLEEQLVVTKRLVLKKELRITRTAQTVTAPAVSVRLRRENIVVKQTSSGRRNPKT